MNAGTSVVDIELLYLDLATCDRCRETDRNLEAAIARVRGELEAAGLAVSLVRRHVRSEAEAMALGMAIAPTIRVNGHDSQPGWAASTCGADPVGKPGRRIGPCERADPPLLLRSEAVLRVGAQGRTQPEGKRHQSPRSLRSRHVLRHRRLRRRGGSRAGPVRRRPAGAGRAGHHDQAPRVALVPWLARAPVGAAGLAQVVG